MHKQRDRRNSRSQSRERGKNGEKRVRLSRRRSRSRSPGRRNELRSGKTFLQRSPSRSRSRSRPQNQRHASFDRHQRDDDNNRTKEVKVKIEPQSPKDDKKVKKQAPDFGLTGKLAEDTNIYNGIVIKYNEPTEARKPKRRWRLYPFKGDVTLPMLPIHRQSAYLLGRERRVADIPIDHPSCSKQHAVLQFRLVKYKRPDDTVGQRVRPYIIDLDSANGTYVNNQKIEPRRYVELFEKDVIKFGFSTREYVILHEESKEDDDQDDNVVDDEEENAKNEAENIDSTSTANVSVKEG